VGRARVTQGEVRVGAVGSLERTRVTHGGVLGEAVLAGANYVASLRRGP